MDAQAWFSRGMELSKANQYLEALNCFDHATMLDPEMLEAWYNKGLGLARQNRYEEAVKCYDEALAIVRKNVGTDVVPNITSLSSVWYNRANSLLALTRYQEAIESYNCSVEIEPTKATAWANMGAAYVRSGHLLKAIDSFEQALSINLQDQIALQGLILCRTLLNDTSGKF